MIALFFEVLPRPGQENAYFQLAASLKPALDDSGGLLFLDRSKSQARPGWFLSHQIWADEESMIRWRGNAAHHRAQVCGRTGIMADYRLRVAEVVAATTAGGAPKPAEAMPGTADWMLSLISTAPLTGPPGESFTSVYDPSLHVSVATVPSAADGAAVLARVAGEPALKSARLCRVIRDYGMFARAEAPQYFPPVTFS